MMDLRNIRKWINRDDGNLFAVGNYNLNAFEIIGYLVGLPGLVILAVKALAEFKPYGWFLSISGFIFFIYGTIKNPNA